MQQRQPLRQARDEKAGIAAVGEIAPRARLEPRPVADQRGVDRRVERRGRSVGDDRLDVVDLDARLAVRIENELGDFAARRAAVRAHQPDQIVARLRRDGHAGGARLRVDQRPERAPVVGIAFDRRRVVGLLERAAQRSAAFQRSRLDDDRAIDRRPREQRRQRRQQIARLRLDPHGARAAEHRHRIDFVGERAGIARHGVAVETRQQQRIGGALQRRADQRLDALVDEPFVGAMNEEEAHVARRPLDEGVGRHVADRRHRFALARLASPMV